MDGYKYITMVVVALMSNVCMAQDSFEEYRALFDKRFAIMQNLVFDMVAEPVNVNAKLDFSPEERVKEVDDEVNRNIELLKSRNGLTATGQINYRPVYTAIDDTDEPYNGYDSRWQVGLEWNYFQSALYKSASRIQELRLKGETEQLEFQKNNLQGILLKQKTTLRNHYHALMMYVLQIHSDNLDLLSKTQVFLLKNGKISSDDLLKVMNEKAEIDNRLTSMKADTSLVAIQSCPQAAIVVFDREMLKQHISMYNYDVRKLKLEKDILQCQYEDADYWKTTSISPFLRYSYYTRPDRSNMHSLDFGISLRLPISFETKKQRNAIKAEQELKSRYQQDLLGRISNEVDAIIHELDILNKNIIGENERMKLVKAYISDRINSYRNVAGEYNHIDRLQEYDSFLSSWERMLGFEYERDCKLIELQGYVIDRPIGEFYSEKELSN